MIHQLLLGSGSSGHFQYSYDDLAPLVILPNDLEYQYVLGDPKDAWREGGFYGRTKGGNILADHGLSGYKFANPFVLPNPPYAVRFDYVAVPQETLTENQFIADLYWVTNPPNLDGIVRDKVVTDVSGYSVCSCMFTIPDNGHVLERVT